MASANTTLNLSFKNRIAELEEGGHEGTRLYYDNVLKGIERYKGENIQFSSITVDWPKGYEKFLRNEDKKKSFTSIGMQMRAIRAIINQGKKAGIIKEIIYPFGQGRYEIPTGEGRKMALQVKQIGDVVHCSDGFPASDISKIQIIMADEFVQKRQPKPENKNRQHYDPTISRNC